MNWTPKSSPPCNGELQTPNMALQRTRGLSAAQFLFSAGQRLAVQSLPGRRSPLNAVALGGPNRCSACLRLVDIVAWSDRSVEGE